MCGIVGLIASMPREQGRRIINRMLSRLQHRGPDGSGAVELTFPGHRAPVFLGHVRLSIIDLSQISSQPMIDEETGSCLVYNGEIYNFRELRRELQQAGIRFRSNGDSEVLLKALVQWGPIALRRVRGMFAFAFWNGLTSELTLARDPLGIKPLYYFKRGGTFLFGSEIGALRGAGLCEFDVDIQATRAFLTYGAVIGPQTAFQQVKELAPGCLITLTSPDEEIKVRPYWSLREAVAVNQEASFSQGVERVSTALASAAESHMSSDVPVGILFSGGIDSTLIASMAEKGQHRSTLLTVGFPEQEYSEVPYAVEVARSFSFPHEVISLSATEFQNLLGSGLDSMDQPTVDGLNIYVISGLAASLGFRVILSGVGGDELFGGYTTFRKLPWLLRYRRVFRSVAPLASRMSSNPVQWRKIRDGGPCTSLTHAYLLQRSIRWRDVTKDASSPGSWFIDALRPTSPGIQDFHQVSSLELLFYMRNQLLRDSDVFSMAHSIELRVPLLDLDVLQATLSLPQRHHFDAHGGKRISRAILKKCGVWLRSRQKRGFSFPWAVWLKGTLNTQVRDALYDNDSYDALGLDSRDGIELFTRFKAGDPTVPWSEVWSLFVLLHWHRRCSTRSREYAESSHPPIVFQALKAGASTA